MPDDLVREVFLFGDGDAMRERLAAFADAGITSLCLDPVGPPSDLAAFIDALGAAMSDDLRPGADGRPRCGWGTSTPEYEAYHDEEWGRPVRDADAAVRAPARWRRSSPGCRGSPILRKRPAFRAAFAGFAIDEVGGVRHRPTSSACWATRASSATGRRSRR